VDRGQLGLVLGSLAGQLGAQLGELGAQHQLIVGSDPHDLLTSLGHHRGGQALGPCLEPGEAGEGLF
jgi:hypothetical protein